jgi:hypothetical protein
MEAQHPVYLNGRWNLDSGFPDYYLCALAYKLPHATQLLLVVSFGLLCCARGLPDRFRMLALLGVPIVALLGVASNSSMQLGVRYILPIFPFLYLLASYAGTIWTQPAGKFRKILLSLGVPFLLWGLRYHPHHLAYFNELAGGPAAGSEHLLDSNIDWGQDLYELSEYLQAHQIEEVGLAYFGMLPPARLGIPYHFPPSISQVQLMHQIPPGWYAISVNFVAGRPHTIRDRDDSSRAVNYLEFGYFRELTPAARIGWSINLYRVDYEP